MLQIENLRPPYIGEYNHNTASMFLANAAASIDIWRKAEDILTSYMKDLSFRLDNEEPTRFITFLAAQFLTEGDLDKLVGRLVLQDISPVDIQLLRFTAARLNSDLMYDESFESADLMYKTWVEVGEKYREEIGLRFK